MSITVEGPRRGRREARVTVPCHCCGDTLVERAEFGDRAHRPLGPKGPAYCEECVEHAVMIAGEVPP